MYSYNGGNSANVWGSGLSLSGGEEQHQVVVSYFDFQTHGNDQAGRFILSLRKLFLKL